MKINFDKNNEWHWGWSAALLGVVLIALAFRYALPIRDGDIWWHMLYGKYFVDNHTLIADHTIFSWTPTTNDTIYCTWLADIFFYGLYSLAGLPGLFAFRYLCLSILAIAAYYYSRTLKLASHPLVWIVCLIALLMSYTAAFVKPEIFSFTLMTLAAWNWWHIRTGGNWRNCYLFPVIMLVWVNSHGGFIFGFVFMTLIVLGEVLNTRISKRNSLSTDVRRHLIISMGIVVLSLFLNPYGYKYLIDIFYALIPNEANLSYNNKIAAYTSTYSFAGSIQGFKLYSNLAIAILLFLFMRAFKKIEWSLLLTNLVFAFLYTKFIRTTFYWAPVFLFSGIYLMSAPGKIISGSGRFSQTVMKGAPMVLLLVAFFLAGDAIKSAMYEPEPYLWMGFGISEVNPVEEAEYIKKYFPRSRIGNLYNQGSYLLWKLWPNNKVFFDARHFPYKKWSDEYFSFEKGENPESVRLILERYQCDLWCIDLSKLNLFTHMINSGKWKLAFYGKNAAILVKAGIDLPAAAPRVSSDIDKLKNLDNAIIILSFTTINGDWSVAEKIVTAMSEKFYLGDQPEKVRRAVHVVPAMKNYFAGNYQTAVEHLTKLHPDIIPAHTVLENCYLGLAFRAWEAGNGNEAFKFSRKAWDVSGGRSIYAAYNLGVIRWQAWVRSVGDDDVIVDSSLDWYNVLNYFIEIATVTGRFNDQIVIAKAILGLSQKERVKLITPFTVFN